MLLKCSSCNSNYLINSADIKPNGRKVRCAVCDYEWFQTPDLNEKEVSEPSGEDKNEKKEENLVSNLPSKYVEDEKPSIINSILILVFICFIIFVYIFIRDQEIGFTALGKFYLQEFYFNLKLIINDVATIIYQIVN